MFDGLMKNITSVFSENGIDILKNHNKNIGFFSFKEIEKVNSYKNAPEKECFESLITIECKIIAKKGMTADSFSQIINDVYADFMFSEDVMPISIKVENLKINSLYSRFESNLILKFRYYFSI